MLCAPSDDAECVNEYLFGETVTAVSHTAGDGTPDNNTVDNTKSKTATDSHTSDSQRQAGHDNKWQMFIGERDGYRGFIATDFLTKLRHSPSSPTHRVNSVSTLLFAEPSIKSTVLLRIPFMSQVVACDESETPFVRLDTGVFIWQAHLTPINTPLCGNPLHLAYSLFLGSPYFWGGCSPQGVDCSGLIQVLATAKGIKIPRDSGDQENALTHDVVYAQRQAEDIVYWPGHTGILVNPDTLLHATAHSLNCLVEPLAAVTERAGAITSIKRLFNQN